MGSMLMDFLGAYEEVKEADGTEPEVRITTRSGGVLTGAVLDSNVGWVRVEDGWVAAIEIASIVWADRG